MSIEEIIRAWKAEDGEEKNENTPPNPAGDELSDEDLEDVEGGSENRGTGIVSHSCMTASQTSCV